MQGLEAIGERVAVTNVALASLRLAVAQQMQFETLLEEVVKRQEDNFGNETATTEERDYADKAAGEGDDKENPTGFKAIEEPDEDSRGGALNIQV